MDPRPSKSARGHSAASANVLESQGHAYYKDGGDGAETKRLKLEENEMESEFRFGYESIPWALRGEKDPVKKNKMMEEFKASLPKNSNQALIVPKISINDARDVELWKSFGVLGKEVTAIKIDLHKVEEPTWLTTLLNLLPNLKHLELEDYEYEEDEDDDLLSSLFNKQRSIVVKVLTSVMSKAKKDRDPLIISSITLRVEKKEHLKQLEEFSDCNNIKIEELKILLDPGVFKGVPQFETRILNAVGKLVSASQNILTSLSLPCCEAYLSNLDFPPMAKLTKLKLDFFSKTCNYLRRCEFPRNFRFSEKLPHLKDVALGFQTVAIQPQDDFFKNLFQNTGIAPTVKKLKYSTLYQDVTIAPILQAFPNVKKLEVGGSRCCKKMLGSIWEHGENLKKLKIIFHLEEFFGDLADLDSIFTGFAPEVVDWINKVPKGIDYRFKNLETSRVNSSILKLKNLEHLTISIMAAHGIAKEFVPKKWLAVTGDYAFKLMPKSVKILIYVHDCCSGTEHTEKVLKEVLKLPNVEIDRDDGWCGC